MSGNKLSDANVGKGVSQETDARGFGNEIARADIGGGVTQRVGVQPGLSIWGYRANGLAGIVALVIIAVAGYYFLR
jgi:hypothetical protein